MLYSSIACGVCCLCCFFFFKQKTAYEMRISDWSSDVCSSDLLGVGGLPRGRVVEIYGPESSGKTTLTLQVIAEMQKIGGTCAFIDAEQIGSASCRERVCQYV